MQLSLRSFDSLQKLSSLWEYLPSHFTNIRKGGPTILTKRNLHASCKSEGFWVPNRKGDHLFEPEKDTRSLKEHVKRGGKRLIPETKKWFGEVKEHFAQDNIKLYRPPDNVVDKYFEFNGPESLDSWVASSDQDVDFGYSTAFVSVTPSGTGVFSGNLSTDVPKTGKNRNAGYANLRFVPPRKSFDRDDPYIWVNYTHLFLRVRGDGRTYMINLHTPETFDIMWLDIYSYVLHTRGGPYWQETKIPFSKFFLNYKGRIQDQQFAIDLANIHNLSITISDKNNGPYRLEVDHIGCLYDPSHEEQFAYETYHLPRFTGRN